MADLVISNLEAHFIGEPLLTSFFDFVVGMSVSSTKAFPSNMFSLFSLVYLTKTKKTQTQV
ncbi:hypothetical protein CCACVL1_28080 [Corchorus capsularis]|uniref:Uncharacterized protein n=1 Tax=Corchorus capsularis TaxID=210143 RepID=A0A1R3G7K9_COCAP|nr:hypothetical protein CCACVL1_28080 [Corchorus capsularis]